MEYEEESAMQKQLLSSVGCGNNKVFFYFLLPSLQATSLSVQYLPWTEGLLIGTLRYLTVEKLCPAYAWMGAETGQGKVLATVDDITREDQGVSL